MTVTGCDAVYVDCDPGFPLTIRLHQTRGARELGELGGGSGGYPVIDTTGRLGLLCSGGTDQAAVTMICRMLGYKLVILDLLPSPPSQLNMIGLPGLVTTHLPQLRYNQLVLQR